MFDRLKLDKLIERMISHDMTGYSATVQLFARELQELIHEVELANDFYCRCGAVPIVSLNEKRSQPMTDFTQFLDEDELKKLEAMAKEPTIKLPIAELSEETLELIFDRCKHKNTYTKDIVICSDCGERLVR